MAVAALSASAQPTWTDIMNHTGYTTMASGVYWEFSNQDTNNYNEVTQTDIASLPNSPNLGVPRDSIGNPVTAGGNDPVCTSQPSYWTTSPPYYRVPQQRIESYYGAGVKGVGFLGTFGAGSVGTFYSGSYLFESVYFHEQSCYFGGREFGFFYDAYNGDIYAYWEVNANCGSSYCTAGTDSNCSTCTSGTDYQQNVSLGSSLVDYGAVPASPLARFHVTPFQTVRAVFPHTA